MRKSLLQLALVSAFSLPVITACVSSSDAGDNSQTQSAVTAKLNQAKLNAFAQGLQVSYRHVDNRADKQCSSSRLDGLCFQVQITLTANQDFNHDNWQIFFSQIAPMQSFESEYFELKHINGDLHRITPKPGFKGFKADHSKTLNFRADGWMVSESDAFPNYYIVAEGLTPEIIQSTVPVVDPDTGLQQRTFVETLQVADSQGQTRHFKRISDDKVQYASPAAIYQANIEGFNAEELTEQQLSAAIIPTPSRTEILSNQVIDLTAGYRVQFDRVNKKLVAAALNRLNGLGIQASSAKNAIPLKLSQAARKGLPAGSYELSITSKAIEISGVDISGVANGIQSLASLVSVGNTTLPQVKITDSPHYQFRGLHVDVSRNFHSKELILKLIEQMAAFKLNKLHLHMADDEGWRIEIDGLPELTELGGKRCFDPSEDHCLQTQLGSGPSTDTHVNGYYSKADYIDILQAASAHHIQVIPSLDMPGHSRAAVKAMELRYRKLMAQGDKAGAEQYLLSDFADTTKYQSIQFYNDNTINVCMPSSYHFIEKVLDEMKALHSQAGHPLTRYHIGADETAGAWVESPICQDFMAKNPQIKKFEDLTGYFIEQVAGILTKRGIETAGWGDGMSHTIKQNMPRIVQANAWTPLFWNGHRQAHELANRDWQVVGSIPEFTYFDFPYEADPKEHGYYWASRHTNTRKVFEFMPDNLPLHAETHTDRMGLPMELDDTKDEKGTVALNNGRRFVGIQGHLWSENVLTDTRAQYMLFPRLIALAERAWHKADWAPKYNYQGAVYSQTSGVFTPKHRQQRDSQWQQFAQVMGHKVLPKLDAEGVFYRLPTVGAVVKNGQLHTNVIFPGLKVEYRLAGGHWQSYQAPVDVSGIDSKTIELRTSTADGKRKGRITRL